MNPMFQAAILPLGEPIRAVELRTGHDLTEVFVNGSHYASAHVFAGQDALDIVREVHAAALLALHGRWTAKEMHQALAHLQIARQET